MRPPQPVLPALAVLAVFLAGCSAFGSSTSDGVNGGDAAKGRRVYEGTCAGCHGGDGRGIPNVGKDFVSQSEWMKKQDDAALVAFIKQGRPSSSPENTTKIEMPPKGGNTVLTHTDIVNVVAYIRELQGQQ